MADVKGSTRAIEAGQYKNVNIVGASCIAAVLNALKPARIEVPYVFGGDGATLVVPDSTLERVKVAMLGTRRMAREEFNLELRVGAVSVRRLRERGASVRVGRYALSGDLNLAVFAGGGLTLADQIVKSNEDYAWVDSQNSARADFSGLECRWEPLATQRGEMLSVLIRAVPTDLAQAARIYQAVIDEIGDTIGRGASLNPVTEAKLRVNVDPRALRAEQRVRTFGKSLWLRLKYGVNLWATTLFGLLVFAFNLKTHGVDWSGYKRAVTEQSDFWKYDDMLRFVVDVSAEQRQVLETKFAARHRAGEIIYGIHSSPRALMTCLVFDRKGQHVHFVDGGDGGYALAAKALKAQAK
ncbi:MAG: DUF3095 domain-containing protein [Bdellovibrionales bacterium]|nr:DUF3095 domain-containing protein [Bdellovibrionales bacterium]